MASPPDKVCASCGRAFAWRKAWARDWDQVRYCSDACRRRKVRPVDRALEAAILELLAARAPGATICPSEAARQVVAARSAREPVGEPPGGPYRASARAPGRDPDRDRTRAPARDRTGDPVEETAGAEAWRELMEPARRAARRLVASGEVELTQRGRVVDPSSFRGPVRIRRARN